MEAKESPSQKLQLPRSQTHIPQILKRKNCLHTCLTGKRTFLGRLTKSFSLVQREIDIAGQQRPSCRRSNAVCVLSPTQRPWGHPWSRARVESCSQHRNEISLVGGKKTKSANVSTRRRVVEKTQAGSRIQVQGHQHLSWAGRTFLG